MTDGLEEFIRDMASPADGPDLTDDELGKLLKSMSKDGEEDAMTDDDFKLVRWACGAMSASPDALDALDRLRSRLSTAERERDAAVSDLERERPITKGYLPCREALARAERVVEAAQEFYEAYYAWRDSWTQTTGGSYGDKETDRRDEAAEALERALATLAAHTQEVTE